MQFRIFVGFVILALSLSCKSVGDGTSGDETSLSSQDLDATGVMDKNTFTGQTNVGRKAPEREVVKRLEGFHSLPQIRAFGRDHFDQGEEIELPSHAEAWLQGASARDANGNFKTVGIDDLSWGNTDHSFRESNPFVALVPESSRIKISNKGNFKVTNGEDLFVDVYYDTDNFDLLKEAITVRQRLRFTDPNQIRRVLIQSKIERGIDPVSGLKIADKQDIRRDFSADCGETTNCWKFVNTLDGMVKSGVATFSGSAPRPMEAMKAVYDHLATKNSPALTGPNKELRISGKAAVMSRRARYHMDLKQEQPMMALLKRGEENIELLKPIIKASNLPNKTVMLSAATGLTGAKKAFLKNAQSRLNKVGGGNPMSFIPNGSRLNTMEEVKKVRAVADSINFLYHKFAAGIKPLEDQSREVRDKIRQIEASGSMALALWMRSAEKFMLNRNFVPFGNFFIDTFDFSQMLNIDDFKKMSNAEVRWQTPFDRSVNIHKASAATIVNEVQIELTQISPYIQIAAGSDKDRSDLAKFVLQQYGKAQESLAERRFERLKDATEKLNIKNLRWVNATESKGQVAIEMARRHAASNK